MSYGRKKTVWILGAGFSRSLGGPLLNDLLSPKGEKQSTARFGKSLNTDMVYTVFKDGHHKDSQIWDNAEDFLEAVDLATDPSEGPEDHRGATSRLLLELIKKRDATLNIRKFRTLALKAIAAECSFDRWSDPKAEAWIPYLRWGEALTEDDTIVTFNYDSVVERLATRLEELKRSNGLTSNDSLLLPGGILSARVATHVLKLHGSLRWGISTRGSKTNMYNFDGNWDDHEKVGDYEPLIGMPGATKSLWRQEHFDQIWRLALKRVEEAEVLVFFGYRFPPSDAQSRSEILGAIKVNKANSIRIHIVLGPDVNHHDTLRLEKMLEVTLRGAGRIPVAEVLHTSSALPKPPHYAILKQPLLVQDFMTIMDEKFLNALT